MTTSRGLMQFFAIPALYLSADSVAAFVMNCVVADDAPAVDVANK